MKPIIKVFVTGNCPGCDEARKIIAHIERDYPEIDVKLIDITNSKAIVPEAVFATPTYMLDDRIVSLGNPSPEQIAGWVEEVTAVQPEH